MTEGQESLRGSHSRWHLAQGGLISALAAAGACIALSTVINRRSASLLKAELVGMQAMVHLFTAQAELCREQPALAGKAIERAMKRVQSLPDSGTHSDLADHAVLLRAMQLLQLGDVKSLLEGNFCA